MAELAGAGAAGFSDDGFPVADAHRMRQALQYQRLAGLVLALHEEDPSLSGAGVMHEGAVSTSLGLAGIPSVSESVAIARDSQLARYEDGRIHVLHVSAAESVEALERAQANGAQVTAEVTPHHLALTDEALRTLDPNFKMNPPLRSERDRQALIGALRAGVIGCVATDHAPHSREEKEAPFEEAPMGVTGLETAFAVLFTDLVVPGVLGLEVLVERMTAGGLPYGLRAPTLARGAPANLCLVDLNASWTVGEAGYESRSDNSCFAGRDLRGRVLVTVARGSVAYRDRSFAIRLAADPDAPVAGRESA
jgi:dihydroorotase